MEKSKMKISYNYRNDRPGYITVQTANKTRYIEGALIFNLVMIAIVIALAVFVARS